MTIKITHTTDNRIAVVSPYNAAFIAKARETGGKWSAEGKSWVFPAEAIEQVRQILRAVYGEDDRPAKTVRLRVKYTDEIDTGSRGEAVVGGRQIARAFGRDSGARMGDDVVVLKGGFSSGGSIKNWRLVVRDETAFDILRLPEGMAQRLVAAHPEHCQIVADDGSELPNEARAANVVPIRSA